MLQADDTHLVKEYYEGGEHKGKIKEIKTPSGTTAQLVTLKRFVYGDGYTEVIDSYNNRTVYRHAKEGHITSIENYNHQQDLYRTERFFWEKIDGDYKLISDAVEDESGHFWTCRTYAYDKHGNVIKETLYGDLTGKHVAPLLMQKNGLPVENGVEKYSICSEYSDDEYHQLLCQKEENGKITSFSYDPKTHLLYAKFILENQSILIREFYFHNEKNQLERTIRDNGSTEDPSDLTHVTERHITTITPDGIQESYLDLTTGEEVPLQKLKKKATTPDCIYDAAHRPVQVKEIAADGTPIVTTYRYDHLGHKIATIDTYGNEILYDYDVLGRLIKTTFPQVLDENDRLINPVEEVKYNLLNQVTAVIDSYDYVTLKRYNIRGQPVDIVYADNTKESYEYNRDGSLYKSVGKNGGYTIFTYDVLGRVIRSEKFSKSDQFHSFSTSQYNAFHLIAETNLQGYATYYNYDNAGRLESIQKETDDGIKRIEYGYDEYGEINLQREWFGPNPDDYTAIVTERDSEGTVAVIRVIDAQGNVLKESLPVTNLPIQAVNESTINNRGQHVRQKTETDSLGVQTISTYDALGRLESTLKKNSLGIIVFHKEYRYDLVGNKAREIDHVILNGKDVKTSSTYWIYGPNRRLEEIIENEDSPRRKKTVYHYNSAGLLKEIVKPDGIHLYYDYNSEGLLSRSWSSDNTINYYYSYDTAGNLIEIQDKINKTHTKRYYDSQHRIVEETLGNDLTLKNQYDLQGRRTLLTLPDQSGVEYIYDAAFLRSINRISAQYRREYSHQYKDYDLSGQLMRSEMIGNLGDLDFLRDEKARLKEIQSKYFCESIDYDETDNIIGISTKDPEGEYATQYEYDDNSQIAKETGLITNTYECDSLYNRITRNGDTYSYEDNFLTSCGSTDYTYDTNGNMVEKQIGDQTVTYTYDALNRLIKVTSGQDYQIVYTYDAFHRQLSRQTRTWNPQKNKWVANSAQHFLYDGDREIGSATKDKQITELRILGIGLGAEIGASIAIELDGKAYAPIHDHRGCVSCLVDIQTQEATESYRFTAFGEEIIPDSLAPKNPWRFSSKRIDPLTGLVHFGKREYDPATGRWTTKDPLGFVEGPNRYAYSQNNPLTRYDLYGLFSITEAWKSFTDAVSSTLSKIDSFIISQMSYQNFLPQESQAFLESIFGPIFLVLDGYYEHPLESGVVGEGDANNVRITFINGILNIRNDCIEAAEMLSTLHGGINIHYIFRPTEGWTKDVLQSMMVKFGYCSPQAVLLAQTWKQLIQEMGGPQSGGTIIHYAHSIGGTDTLAAKNLLTAEEQKMIQVITMGSPSMINDPGLGSCINYVSVRDGVCMLDPINYIKGLFFDSNIVFLSNFSEGYPFIDHLISDSTYRSILEQLGLQFIQTYLN